MRLKPEEILLTTALDIELPIDFGSKSPWLITGMGKISASVALVEYLLQAETEVKLVVNLGSVGSHTRKDELIFVDKFSCWDQAYPSIETKEEKREEITYEVADNILALDLPWKRGKCATGDKFVTYQKLEADCFDMEAYGLAYVCYLYNVPLLSVKYISDAGSVKDWFESIPKIQENLAGAHDKIMDIVVGPRYRSKLVKRRALLCQ